LALISIDTFEEGHMKSAFVLGAALGLLGIHAVAGEQSCVMALQEASSVRLTGNVVVDLFGPASLSGGPFLSGQGDVPIKHAGYKSPWLAAGLSAMVPGAGEFYAESYWKSAAFFAAEAVLWVIAYSYDKKGDRQTDKFQGFADSHWNVIRYAQWTLDNTTNINPGIRASDYPNVLMKDQGGAVVGVNWSELNRLERDLGNWYSHTLPPFGVQQYYELIGKYQQFNQGWDDADQTPGVYTYGKPLTANFLYYSGERGKANTYYDNASTAVTIVIVNHVLSLIDAAWSASSYNRVHVELGTQTVPVETGYARVPVVRLSYPL
jgi:hypothetical protein